MKKTLVVLVALVMALTLVVASASAVGAGKPAPYLKVSGELLVYDDAGIYGTPGLVYIDCSLEWENIGAWGYKVEWGPAADPDAYFDIGGGKKLRKFQTTLKLVIPEATIEDQYTINATLLDRQGNPIGYSNADTVWPSAMMTVTTALFAEHFTNVANGALPYGWSTNRTDLCSAYDSQLAGGVAPELYIKWDDKVGEWDYSDYWVSTYEIEATSSVTANLTLSFDHYFELWSEADDAYPYTILVEVSANNGTTWNPTSFVDTPTLAEYPSTMIGPEKVYIDLSTYAGQTIMIRWRVYGYTYMMNEWDIDNVVLTGY